MKKKILPITTVYIAVIFLFLGCARIPQTKPTGFVYIEDDVFKIDDTVFFPLMINYKVDFRRLNDDIVISPAVYYENGDTYESNTKEDVLKQFSNHLELVKELGFNTVRLCIDVVKIDSVGRYYLAKGGRIYLKDNTEKIIEGINDALNIAKINDLKVMLLLKPPFDEEVQNFTIEILKYFKDNPTIFAYDFMNEPLYFDTDNNTKEDAISIVKEWKKMIDKNAPNHLFTIGFSEPIEVFEWDPSMLPVDFVQIHTYHPLRIPNEIWWYSNYVGKPWIIGETSLPADNDSISYEHQRHFVKEVYQYVINCGGIGFGWWEFQDHINPYMNFEANYPGLLNHEGITTTKKGNNIIGTLKPAAYEFADLHKLKPRKTVRPINYFNMLGYENYVIKGKIMNGKNPVDGALIRGWNQSWKVGMNTYSDENGNFTLYSNDSCVHFEISAPGMERIKFSTNKITIEYQRIDGKEHDFSDLKNVGLEYHKISYQPFLKNDSSLFNFNEELFNKVKFESDMGTIELESL